MTEPMRFTLPWPPSVNNLFVNGTRGRFLSDRGREYARRVAELVLIGHVPRQRLQGRLALHILASPPDRRVCDLDNLLKAPLDSLRKAGVIRDDADFDVLEIRRGAVIPGGRLDVELAQLP